MTSVEPSRRAALSTGACDAVSHRRVMSCPEVFHRVSSGPGLGALGQVMSMHRLDGQCRPAGRGMELFRWRGGFRDECVPTIRCARGHPAASSRPRSLDPANATLRRARSSSLAAPRRHQQARGAGGSGGRAAGAEQPTRHSRARLGHARPLLPLRSRRPWRASGAVEWGPVGGAHGPTQGPVWCSFRAPEGCGRVGGGVCAGAGGGGLLGEGRQG